MLLENEKHRHWHALGPKDCKFPKMKEAVATISMTRSTISDEQMNISVPVFRGDTRQELQDRIGMFFSIIQDRHDDAAKAWTESEDRQMREIENQKVKAGLSTREEKEKLVEERTHK